MFQIITCVRIGVYVGALTRGKQYELLAHDTAKRQIKVRGDNDRTRWFHAGCFDLTGNVVPTLTHWKFDDPVLDTINKRDATNNAVEVTLTLSDGTMRWCTLVTPDYMKAWLEPRDDPFRWSGGNKPALYAANLIVIRDLHVVTVDWLLHHLDQQGDLIAHSCLLDRTDESSSIIPQ